MTRRPFRDRSGATAVEFAIILWPLLLLLFGTFETARILWVQQALSKTAISTARCVGIRSVGCAKSGTYDRALAVKFTTEAAKGWGITLADKDIGIDEAGVCNGEASFSRVVLSMPFISPVPFVAKMVWGSASVVTAEACFPRQASS